MNDKEKIRAEVERLKMKLLDHILIESDKEYAIRAAHQFNKILNFIDSLPEEPLSENMMEAARNQMMNEIWKNGLESPDNKHPYPVINLDTQEMAFAFYEHGWHFDRDYNPGRNMIWLDIEKILPIKRKEV